VRVPLHVVQARRERLAELIGQHRYLPIRELCNRLGVSEATARRDLAALVGEKKITRTYGGALSDFNDRFPSFRERKGTAALNKAKIAKAALAMIQPGQTCFLDSGTTIFAIAEAFCEKPVTPISIVTSNLPVGELLSAIPDVQVFQLAGQLFHRQSVLLGETALRSLEFWRFDLAFLSAQGMNAEGVWNSQTEIVVQQNAVMRRSNRSVFCLDGSKLNHDAPHFLAAWQNVDTLLTDVSNGRLEQAGIHLGTSQIASVSGKKAAGQNETISSEGGDELPVHAL
jgi:DeoR/GlpR family transcriptional regulator of sugar metabolism